MLKTLNMAQICCPVGFNEEINAAFHMERYKINTGNTKNQKFPIFIVPLQVLSIFW